MRIALQCIGLVVLMIVSRVDAQSITTGAISGVVVDRESEEPLMAVTVTVGTQVTVTDDNGRYKVSGLLPGTYDVVFELADTIVTRGGIVVGANNTTPVFLRMKIGESIRIEGTPPPINTVSIAKEKRIDREQIESFPQPGAHAEDTLGSVAGSQNDGVGVAFSGSSSLENRTFVDGIDITGLTYGDVGTSILNEFVHEIIAVTGGYSAEYGRATGGIVNIITRSGTDTLRGSVFGVYTPGWATANREATPRNASSIDITGDNGYSGYLGFELGGPIVKKKAWFYIGVAPQLSRTDYTRTTKTQTDCRIRLDSGELSTCDPANADAAPDIDPQTGFYLTRDIDREVRSATSRTTQVITKINLAPTKNDQAQLSLITTPSSSRSPALLGVASTGQQAWGLTTDASARWTSKLAGGSTDVEALIAWHRSTSNSGSIDPVFDNDPLQILYGGDLGRISNFGGESAKTVAGCTDSVAGDAHPLITNCPMNSTYSIGGPGSIARDKEERRAARVGIIQRLKAVGTHELKAGLDFEDNRKTGSRLYSGGAFIQNYGSSVTLNRWAELARPNDMDPRFDRTCTTPDEGGTGPMGSGKGFRCRYLGGIDDPSTRIEGQTINWGAYLQDSWQPMRSLTLNAGLRYEEQRLRYASSLRNSIDPLTQNRVGANAMTLRGNFSPRLGVIYDPTHEGRSKVYGGWGRYFEGIPMDINDRSFGGEVSLQQTYNASDCGPINPQTGFADASKCVATTATPQTERLLGSSGVLVAPGIRAQYMDETLLGAELALPSDVVVGAVIQYRRIGRVIEDVSTDGANTYIIANPGEWSESEERRLMERIARTTDKLEAARLERDLRLFRGIRTFDKPVRDYLALELNVARKFASGLYLSASYTHSRAEGNYPGLVSYDNGQIDPNISSQYDLIELLGNRRGRLPQDRPHYVKLDAYRGFDVGAGKLTLGTRVRAMSGIPKNALGAHYVYGADESFLLPRGQLGRTEFEHGIDIKIGYKRKLPRGMVAELFVDVFNLYNRQGTFRVDDTYAPQYALAQGGAGGQEQNANPVSGGTYEDLMWAKAIDKDGNASPEPLGRNPNFHRTTTRYAPASAQIGFRVTF